MRQPRTVMRVAVAAILAILVVLPLSADVRDLGISTFTEVRKHFKNPPAQFRTMPFWVWNTEVTREQIDRQLADYKEMGFGGIFIHPRYGLITEYLSPEWFSLVEYSVERGKSLGLEVWLYDENSFPSGFAGGHVPARMPESYNQGQGLQLTKRSYPTAEEIRAAFLALGVEDDGGFAIVDTASRPVQEGDYYLFSKTFYEKSKWYGGFSYIDLVQPGVTEKFIELTMKGYEESIGTEFGEAVPGIFTDEPHLDPPSGPNTIRWTPTLFDDFQERWGYDLRPHLPSLFEEVGDWQRVRHNYYKLLLELFIERWSKPWYRYTESKDLLWTGHYWEHEWPNPRQGPDNMAMYAWHQLPAIDLLFNTFDFNVNAQFGNVRVVKELSSVANQYGRNRTLSETYGAAGWELRFEDMKRLGDWQYALGVNFMNQHLSYMSLAGDRKHDFPQSFSEHEPWWHLYHYQAEYFARLSLALSAGKQLHSTLVIEPTTSAWLYYSPISSHFRFDQLAEEFQEFTVQMERKQFEFDLGSEQILEDTGRVKGKLLTVGERDYSVLVLPPGVYNLNGRTVELIEEFLKGGGRLIAFGDPPGRIDGKKNDQMIQLAEQYSGRWTRFESLQEASAADFGSTEYQIQEADMMDGLLFHHRRTLEDGLILFLINSSLQEVSSGTAWIEGESLSILGLQDGSITPYAGQRRESGVEFEFNLAPAGSLLLFAAKRGDLVPPGETEKRFHILEEASPISIERLGPNVLTMDYCDLTLDEESWEGIYFYSAANEIWKHHGFPDNPWVSAAQYKTGILDRAESFRRDSGFTARFPFHLEAGVDSSELRAVVERPNLWKVSVNDHELEPLPGEWWLDRSFGVFAIGKFVTEGENSISLSTSPMCIHCELEPVYLLGEFALIPRNRGWSIAPARALALGDWKAQGLPFFSHGVSYSREVEISETSKSVLIRLSKWDGSVSEVLVNGEHAGIIQSKPYELEIAPFLSAGRNRLEVIVYGSLKNLLGPHHNVSRTGIVTPWSFKFAPQEEPPGTEYDLLEYGLKAPFEIVVEE